MLMHIVMRNLITLSEKGLMMPVRTFKKSLYATQRSMEMPIDIALVFLLLTV